ncbi:hypothetical protein BC567DRAFT_232639 [Phyllosticta citribraziliensis]
MNGAVGLCRGYDGVPAVWHLVYLISLQHTRLRSTPQPPTHLFPPSLSPQSSPLPSNIKYQPSVNSLSLSPYPPSRTPSPPPHARAKASASSSPPPGQRLCPFPSASPHPSPNPSPCACPAGRARCAAVKRRMEMDGWVVCEACEGCEEGCCWGGGLAVRGGEGERGVEVEVEVASSVVWLRCWFPVVGSALRVFAAVLICLFLFPFPFPFPSLFLSHAQPRRQRHMSLSFPAHPHHHRRGHGLCLHSANQHLDFACAFGLHRHRPAVPSQRCAAPTSSPSPSGSRRRCSTRGRWR